MPLAAEVLSQIIKVAIMDEKLYRGYFEALLRGDRSHCNAVVERLLDENTVIRDIYVQLFQRSLYQVGELWETNKISVATEHLATAITEGLLSLVYPKLFAMEHTDKKAIVSCAVNEYHQIGGKMVADIFELNGWNSQFLGANTPLDDLLQFIQDEKPDVLALSLSLYSNLPRLLKTTNAIRGNYLNLDIVFGGQAFRWGGQGKMLEILRTQYIPSLHDLEKDLKG